MKKIVKLVPIMLMIIMILSTFSTVMAATNPTALKDSIPSDVSAFDTVGGKIIGMIQSIGNIISIAVLVILGIKYMMGSAEEKAEYKKTLIPYLVGAILIFAASNIAGMVYNFAKTVS